MSTVIKAITAVLAIVWLSGCVIAVGNDGDSRSDGSWQDRERDNRNAIEQLQTGMTYGQVRDWMPHQAEFTESFQADEITYQVLFYRTQRVQADGRVTRDETTPLVFADGFLIGWGEQVWFDITGRPLQ
ncbi:MAG: DUF3192 domain-containing protein [Pseudomonadota bacterium]